MQLQCDILVLWMHVIRLHIFGCLSNSFCYSNRYDLKRELSSLFYEEWL